MRVLMFNRILCREANRSKHLLSILLCMLLLNSCVLPKVVQNDDDCQLVTKELALEKVDTSGCYSGDECIGAAIMGITSTVVSGTIVVVGNTVHWLEKKGRCSDEGVQGTSSRDQSSGDIIQNH